MTTVLFRVDLAAARFSNEGEDGIVSAWFVVVAVVDVAVFALWRARTRPGLEGGEKKFNGSGDSRSCRSWCVVAVVVVGLMVASPRRGFLAGRAFSVDSRTWLLSFLAPLARKLSSVVCCLVVVNGARLGGRRGDERGGGGECDGDGDGDENRGLFLLFLKMDDDELFFARTTRLGRLLLAISVFVLLVVALRVFRFCVTSLPPGVWSSPSLLLPSSLSRRCRARVLRETGCLAACDFSCCCLSCPRGLLFSDEREDAEAPAAMVAVRGVGVVVAAVVYASWIRMGGAWSQAKHMRKRGSKTLESR